MNQKTMPHTHITAKRGLFDLHPGEFWEYRDLIFLFVKKDLSIVYKQTILGPLWLVLNPLMTTLVYTVVFGRIAKLSTDGIPQILFYMAGNAMWSFFSESLIGTAGTFRTNAHLFGKVYFPRLTKPVATVITSAISFLIQMVLFSFFYIYYAAKGMVSTEPWRLLLLPVILILMGGMALGCGIIVSSLTAKYRDLAVAVGFGVRLWMYATPVVYPLSTATEGIMRTLLLINPVTQLMEAFRYCILGTGEMIPAGCVWSAVFTALVLLLGIVVFNMTEKDFMDTI
ncbi:MAG: ABC transporter permease [Oscillospiraceae bacterium]|nr:ABC transporter permease [Oscillospiraceae bacterium]